MKSSLPRPSQAAYIAFISGITTLVSSPLIRRLMIRHDVLDTPNHRSSHNVPIPRGGGLACMTGVVAASAADRERVPVAAVATALSLGLVGFLDDRAGGLPVARRLAAQTALGTIASGSAPQVFRGAVLTPAVVNVVNFMDGINGITGSTAAIWGINAATLPGASNRTRWLGASAAGAGLGFLPWNAPKATLFLGDSGSYLFGGLISAALNGASSNRDMVRVGLPLLPYAADAAQALISGKRQGLPLIDAHRRHVYQQLVDTHGLSHATVTAIHAGVALALAGLSRRRLSVRTAIASGILVAAYLSTPGVLRRLGIAAGVQS